MNIQEQVIAVINTNSAAGETKLRNELSTVELQAESLIIDDEESYTFAANFGRTIKQKQADVTAFFKPLKQAADAAHKAVCDREKEVLIPLQNAEKTVKNGMVAYQAIKEQERKRKEEELRRQLWEEGQKKLEEAARLEAEGKKEAAADMMIEAEVMDNASTVATVLPFTQKTEGVSVKKDWTIELIDANQVPIAFNGFILRPVDMAAVKRLVKENKGAIDIPGIKITETPNIALRR